mmetsp:Transcript_55070/g.141806  ORF Transcript_55070/g.141806 Transcript_55070/m.141806 type:complete len:355 (+) Transcript_55070:100-1164(+)
MSRLTLAYHWCHRSCRALAHMRASMVSSSSSSLSPLATVPALATRQALALVLLSLASALSRSKLSAWSSKACASASNASLCCAASKASATVSSSTSSSGRSEAALGVDSSSEALPASCSFSASSTRPALSSTASPWPPLPCPSSSSDLQSSGEPGTAASAAGGPTSTGAAMVLAASVAAGVLDPPLVGGATESATGLTCVGTARPLSAAADPPGALRAFASSGSPMISRSCNSTSSLLFRAFLLFVFTVAAGAVVRALVGAAEPWANAAAPNGDASGTAASGGLPAGGCAGCWAPAGAPWLGAPGSGVCFCFWFNHCTYSSYEQFSKSGPFSFLLFFLAFFFFFFCSPLSDSEL